MYTPPLPGAMHIWNTLEMKRKKKENGLSPHSLAAPDDWVYEKRMEERKKREEIARE